MPEPAHSERPLAGDGPEKGRDSHPSLPALPLPATVDTVPDGARVGVIVRGELDLEASRHIKTDLLHALSRSADGLDLYLSEVAFCDCSGINLLLRLRRLALWHGKTVTLRTTSPAVERILDLTVTHALFVPRAPEDDDSRDGSRDGSRDAPSENGAEGEAPSHAGETEQDLRATVSQLQRAMQTRPTIDLARGILMSVFTLSPEAAWEVLVTASQNTNTKLHQLAGDLVDTIEGDELPPAVRKQLVNAVAKTTKARAAPGTEEASPAVSPAPAAASAADDEQPKPPRPVPAPPGTCPTPGPGHGPRPAPIPGPGPATR